MSLEDSRGAKLPVVDLLNWIEFNFSITWCCAFYDMRIPLLGWMVMICKVPG